MLYFSKEETKLKKADTLATNNNTKNKQKAIGIVANQRDVFAVWVLLDYTGFATNHLRDMEMAKLELTPERAAI